MGSLDVLVKVRACGLCHHDILAMQGVLRRGVKPQVVLGHEISGEVAEVGDRVDAFKPGDPVCTLLTEACGTCERCQAGREHRCLRGMGIGHGVDGGFAEYVKLSQSSLVRLPANMDLDQACLLACPIGVTVRAAADVAAVQREDTVLVTGAGGGLGAHAVQVAKAMGARVLATTSSEEKVPLIGKLGADEVIHGGELDYSEIVIALTEDCGVDVALDTVGSPTFPSTFRSIAQYGRVVLLGEVSRAQTSINLAEIIFRDARLLGSSGASRSNVESAVRLVAQGRVNPIISQRFPLERALEAYQLMLRRGHFGRLALTPA